MLLSSISLGFMKKAKLLLLALSTIPNILVKREVWSKAELGYFMAYYYLISEESQNYRPQT